MAKKLDIETGEITIVAEPHRTIAAEPPFFKTPWNHDRDAESKSVALTCNDPSRTQQQFAKEADINTILAKFLNTGELNITGSPNYQDFDEPFDLQDQLVTQHQVDQAWQALPAAVRNILKDPKTFTEYVGHCLQTGDLDPLRELGLADPLPDPKAPLAPPEPPQPPTPTGGTPAPVPAEKGPQGPKT